MGWLFSANPLFYKSAPEAIRTHDLQIRKPEHIHIISCISNTYLVLDDGLATVTVTEGRTSKTSV